MDETLDVDIHAVTSALKRYLRKLPDPVIPFDLYDDFIKVSTKASHSKEVRIAELQKIVNKLPPANRDIKINCQPFAFGKFFEGYK